MKKIALLNGFIIATALILAASSCKSKTGEKKEPAPVTADDSGSFKQEMAVYCWCFSNKGRTVNKDGIVVMDSIECQRPAKYNIDSIVKEQNLLLTVNDPEKLARLKELIYRKGEQITANADSTPDARLVLVFRFSEGRSDEFSCGYNDFKRLNQRGHNDYHYSFNILDSVQAIIGVSNIACKENVGM